MAKLSENIKAYRKKHNLSQTDFANKIHVTKQAVSKWETGRGYPDSTLIPVIARTMDISIDSLMGEKRRSKKMYIIVSSLLALTLIVIIITPMITTKIRRRNEIKDFKENIELIYNIDLPKNGTLVTADFEGFIHYGNSINVDQMSYIVFQDNTNTVEFEVELTVDSKWVELVPDDLKNTLPQNLITYTTIGDYYSLYNMGLDTYNEVPTLPGTYDYMFLIYQFDNHRLVVLDYKVVIEEGE